MNATPLRVGDIWRDRDQRSKGTGEFVIKRVSPDGKYAEVHRTETNRHVRIRVRRLLDGKSYERIGAGR